MEEVGKGQHPPAANLSHQGPPPQPCPSTWQQESERKCRGKMISSSRSRTRSGRYCRCRFKTPVVRPSEKTQLWYGWRMCQIQCSARKRGCSQRRLATSKAGEILESTSSIYHLCLFSDCSTFLLDRRLLPPQREEVSSHVHI